MAEVAQKTQISSMAKWTIFVCMCFAIFVVASNDTSVITAIVAIRNQLNMSASQQLWAINIYPFASSPLIIIAAQLADKYGQRLIFFAGLVIFIIASVIIALAGAGSWVIVGRAVTGVSCAILIPVTLAIVCAVFTGDEQPLAVSLWSAMVGLGLAAGPILGGIFSSYVTWRLIFWLNVIICVLVGVVMFFMKQGALEKRDIKLDFKGVVLFGVGLFCLIFALNQGASWGWDDLWIWVILVAGLVLLVIFYFVEQRIKMPLVDFKLFKVPAYTYAVLGCLAITYINLAIFYFFNVYSQNPLGLHFSPMQAGLGILPIAVPICFIAPFAPKLASKLGMRNLIAAGQALQVIGFLWMYFFIGADSSYWDLFVPMLLVGIGLSFCFALVPGVGMGQLKPENINEGSGMLNTAFQTGASFSAAIGTILFLIAGHAVFSNDTAISHLAAGFRQELSKSLLSHKASIGAIIHSTHTTNPTAVAEGLKQAVAYGFNIVMLMCAIVVAISFFLTLFMVKKPKSA